MNSSTQAEGFTDSGISVVIPLYNKESTVERAILSVLRQEGVEKEIIVIDDGSTDGSAERAKKFGDRIIYVRQTNQGPSMARNHGASLSKFNRLVFLDAEDELMAGCLAAHVACRTANPDIEVSLVSFRVMAGKDVLREETLTERIKDMEVTNGVACLDSFASGMVVNIASGAICVNKTIFERAGKFDSGLRCWEITDLMYRLALQGSKIGVLQNFYVTIHESKSESHFQQLRADPKYIVRFADRLLDHISELPENQKELILEKVASLLGALASARNARAFKRLAERACRYAAVANLSNGLCRLSRRSVATIKFSFYFCHRKRQKAKQSGNNGRRAKKCAE